MSRGHGYIAPMRTGTDLLVDTSTRCDKSARLRVNRVWEGASEIPRLISRSLLKRVTDVLSF